MLILVCVLLAVIGWLNMSCSDLKAKLDTQQEATRTAFARAYDAVIRSMEPSGYEMEVAGQRLPIYKPFVYLRPQAACRAHEYTIWNGDRIHSQRTLGPVCMCAGDTLYIHIGTHLTNPNLAPSFSG